MTRDYENGNFLSEKNLSVHILSFFSLLLLSHGSGKRYLHVRAQWFMTIL